MKRIYFGHPVNTYDTPLEKFLIEKIKEKFPGVEIENPNQPHHQEGYRYWSRSFGNGMEYFFTRVLYRCDSGVFLPFRDNTWGAGVFGEAESFDRRDCPIWAIYSSGGIYEVLHLDRVPALTREETRLRVYNSDGSRRPY